MAEVSDEVRTHANQNGEADQLEETKTPANADQDGGDRDHPVVRAAKCVKTNEREDKRSAAAAAASAMLAEL